MRSAADDLSDRDCGGDSNGRWSRGPCTGRMGSGRSSNGEYGNRNTADVLCYGDSSKVGDRGVQSYCFGRSSDFSNRCVQS